MFPNSFIKAGNCIQVVAGVGICFDYKVRLQTQKINFFLCCSAADLLSSPLLPLFLGTELGKQGQAKGLEFWVTVPRRNLGVFVAKGIASTVYCPENKGIKYLACNCLVTKLGLLVKVIASKNILVLQPAV